MNSIPLNDFAGPLSENMSDYVTINDLRFGGTTFLLAWLKSLAKVQFVLSDVLTCHVVGLIVSKEKYLNMAYIS